MLSIKSHSQMLIFKIFQLENVKKIVENYTLRFNAIMCHWKTMKINPIGSYLYFTYNCQYNFVKFYSEQLLVIFHTKNYILDECCALSDVFWPSVVYILDRYVNFWHLPSAPPAHTNTDTHTLTHAHILHSCTNFSEYVQTFIFPIYI